MAIIDRKFQFYSQANLEGWSGFDAFPAKLAIVNWFGLTSSRTVAEKIEQLHAKLLDTPTRCHKAISKE